VNTSAPSSGVFPAANRAYFTPIYVSAPVIVRRLFWANGATIAGNVQAGLYLSRSTGNGPGPALLRGNQVAQAGVTVCQYDDITDTPLSAGYYWVALWCDASGYFMRRIAVEMLRFGTQYSLSGLTDGLPEDASPAGTVGSSNWAVLSGLCLRGAP
jgi:hypothetical protein